MGVINEIKIDEVPPADGAAAAEEEVVLEVGDDKETTEDRPIKVRISIDIAKIGIGSGILLRLRLLHLERRNKIDRVEMTLIRGRTGPRHLVSDAVKKIECRNGVDEGLS